MHDIRPVLPEVFESPGTVLYIGARLDACSWLTELHQAGNTITLLEVWFPNLVGFYGDQRIAHTILGSVVRTALEQYDYIWWWHGPEHIDKERFYSVTAYLRNRARRLLALAAPWGYYPQGSHQGNPHGRHRWSVYEEDFWDVLLETKTDGIKDQPGSEIVGWLRI